MFFNIFQLAKCFILCNGKCTTEIKNYNLRTVKETITNVYFFFILQHVRNSLNGEALAQSYNVDGYHAASNIVYVYQGCIFHGCCKCYPKQRNIKRLCHPDRTVSEVYEATLKKTAILRDAGYTVIEMWGCDFARQKETDPELAKFLENFEFVPPLEPRDAFFGGRTGAATLYAKMAED